MAKGSKCEPTKRCGTPRETAERFGLGVDKLKKMRLFGGGPEFIVAGHRTILYPWDRFEEWMASLPKGGGQTAGSTLEK